MKTLKSIFFITLIILSCVNVKSQNNEPEDRGYIVKNGDMAPDFTINTTDGKSYLLSDLKGKIVMLQFTASWCGVCRKEMPFIESEIWQINKDKDFVLIGIDRDEPIEKVKEFAIKMNINYPLALDPNADIFGLYADKQAGVTRNVIIDRNGKIVYLTRLFNRDEFDTMKSKIEELLQ